MSEKKKIFTRTCRKIFAEGKEHGVDFKTPHRHARICINCKKKNRNYAPSKWDIEENGK